MLGQTTRPTSPTALDTNAKRIKLNSGRARVTRACDRCKRRKVKCNGQQPCDFCQRAQVTCTFDSAYARGRAPIIPSAYNAEIIEPGRRSDYGVVPFTETTNPTSNAKDLSTDNLAAEVSVSSSLMPASTATSVQNSPTRTQGDLYGHYLGPASGLSFLRRVRKRLNQSISFSQPSSIFAFGDPDLTKSDADPSFCMMLSQADAQRLLDRYFDFAMPTYRFLHRPTVQDWFVEFYETFGSMRDANRAPAKLALLFMVIAHGSVYMPDNEKPGPADLSTRYYQAAERQLLEEKGSIRVTSIQARLSQCYYLLTQSRINQCWSLFGSVVLLILAIGLNRNRGYGTGNMSTLVDIECCRRTFWCAYTLDVYLSLVLGRPRMFHDEDIDMDLPGRIEDEALTPGVMTSRSPAGHNMMVAPIAHMKLARIIASILRGLYSIKPISSDRRNMLIERVSKELSDWRVSISIFLDTDRNKLASQPTIVQRQRNVVNLTYWHAIILTYRPFVLENFLHSVRGDGIHGQEETTSDDESVQQCLGAALNTTKTIDEMTKHKQMFRAFWTAAYFAFTASTVLYIYVIYKAQSMPLTSSYISAAAHCQSQISSIAEKGSLPERYCLLLEELRLEAQRRSTHTRTTTPLRAEPNTSEERSIAPISNNLQIGSTDSLNSREATVPEFDDNLPDFIQDDHTDWGEFANLVSSGLGNLDVFLHDDPFML